jgi:hypothetical protein
MTYSDFPESIRLNDPTVSESQQYYMYRLTGFRADKAPFEVQSVSMYRLAEWYVKFRDRMDSTREVTLQEATWRKASKRNVQSFLRRTEISEKRP